MKIILETVVITGGAGFVANHFVRFLLESPMYEISHIYLVDFFPAEEKTYAIEPNLSSTLVHFISTDIRDLSSFSSLPKKSDLLVNFAAVHREPGHLPIEYYETNLKGAEFVTRYAEYSQCRSIIFASSISPYGEILSAVDEDSLPVPVTPYGVSKLCAEYIHKAWQAKDSKNRLTIVRPGVVFGAGEGGNVTRMIKAINGGYFFYTSNRHLKKAGVYVKELCHAMLWVHFENNDPNALKLFNMTFKNCPDIEEYVESIKSALDKKRWIPNVPFIILFGLSFLISACSKMLKIEQPIHPERIKKLKKSNFVKPKYLTKHEYNFKYSLKSAMVDWKETYPEDWR